MSPASPIVLLAAHGQNRSIAFSPVVRIAGSPAGAVPPNTATIAATCSRSTARSTGWPVSTIAVPAASPACPAPERAIPRTTPPPRCWATCTAMLASPPAPPTVSTVRTGGTASGVKRASTTGPRARTIRPTPSAKSSGRPFCLSVSRAIGSTPPFSSAVRRLRAACSRLLTVVTGRSRNAATSRCE